MNRSEAAHRLAALAEPLAERGRVTASRTLSGRASSPASATDLRTAAASARGDVPAADWRTGEPGRGAHRRHRSSGQRSRWEIPSRTAWAAVVALLIIAGAVALRTVGAAGAAPVEVIEPRLTASPSATTQTAADEGTILVHVVGQVNQPGLVELPPGARVADAIAAAGGVLPEADVAALNLAAPVQDGVQIRVPAPGESGSAAIGAGGETIGEGNSSTGVLNLNTATAADLEALPGIGPVLSERIIADRAQNGQFGSVDDLGRVTGIGPAILTNIRDLVGV